MARRRKSSSSSEGGAYWMDTYGDMVTLLLAFFVLLFSFSTIDASKWEALVGALSGTGSSVITVMDERESVQDPIEMDLSMYKDKSENADEGDTAEIEMLIFLQLVESIEEFIDENNLTADIHAQPDAHSVTMRFSDSIFFDSGKADIREESYMILDKMAELFYENMHLIEMIAIEGHTDNVPISNAQFADNWDLSSKRATNTLRYITGVEDINKARITASGYSEYQPVETNDTEAGRAANRRVDFVIYAMISYEQQGEQ